jgi:hypothetical protein
VDVWIGVWRAWRITVVLVCEQGCVVDAVNFGA